jgi:uncharacterized protein (TIGR00255 family)
MRSMTGYGRASADIAGRTVNVQVSSVNRKTLDLTVKLPDEWETLEPAVGEKVRARATRGKVHVVFEPEAPVGGEDIAWDDTAVRQVLSRLRLLAAAQGTPFHPTADLLWQIANSRRQPSGLPRLETAQEPLLAALDRALAEFTAMRAKEGAALLADFLARIEVLGRLIAAVAARAPAVVPAYGELLHKRLREAGLTLDLSDERVLREIALFADRCDVSEEITRFRSHLEQFAALLGSEGEIGRKAEFILQELGRETHTLGSKANDLAISRHVIELKNELERIKEQIANVE